MIANVYISTHVLFAYIIGDFYTVHVLVGTAKMSGIKK